MNNKIIDILKSSVSVKNEIINNAEYVENIKKSTKIIIDAFKNKGAVYFCGNGGSAADAQHLAAEFSGRFYYDRDPLNSEALHVNTSYLTAVANDYSYSEIFARLLKSKAKKGDVLIGLSTSGNSENIIKAMKAAKELEVICIGFTGKYGGKMKEICDVLINVPSNDTPRIQEAHITIGHIICQIVEETIFPKI